MVCPRLFVLWPLCLVTICPYSPFFLLVPPACVNAYSPQSGGCKRKENQLGTPVVVPFPSQICKSCMWSQPLDRCTRTIVEKQQLKITWGEEMSHSVRPYSPFWSLQSCIWVCLCTGMWRGERMVSRIACSLMPLSVVLSLQLGGSSRTSLQNKELLFQKDLIVLQSY